MPPPTANRKRLLWTLALVTLLAIAGTVIWRHQVNKRQAGLAAQAARKKERKTPAEKPADKHPPPKMTEPKATVLGPAAKEHLAENTFIAAVRAVFLWRNTQPPENLETNRVLVEKLSAIACEDLPEERKNAWRALLQAWKAQGDSAGSRAPQILEQERRAAEVLNAMFKAHGDGDLVL